MSARHDPRSALGVNVILLSDGGEIHLDDIETAEQGQAVLDDLDAAIDSIEIQIEGRRSEVDLSWLQRARTALKRKRRQRPRLQQRIGELRRALRRVEPAQPGPGPERRDARRKAFIDAAEELLPVELFTEVWARAAEREPMAFAEGGAP